MLFDEKNTVLVKIWPGECYSGSAPLRQVGVYWVSEFKCGRKNTDDGERSGRPKQVVTTENMKKSPQNLFGKSLIDMAGESWPEDIKETCRLYFARTVVHEKGVFQINVSLLTADIKQQPVDDSEVCLELFRWNRTFCDM